MERELLRLIGRERADEKQRAREVDALRLASGEASPAEMQNENHFFGCLDLPSFRIAAVGDQEIHQAR